MNDKLVKFKIFKNIVLSAPVSVDQLNSNMGLMKIKVLKYMFNYSTPDQAVTGYNNFTDFMDDKWITYEAVMTYR